MWQCQEQLCVTEILVSSADLIHFLVMHKATHYIALLPSYSPLITALFVCVSPGGTAFLSVLFLGHAAALFAATPSPVDSSVMLFFAGVGYLVICNIHHERSCSKP